MKEIGIYKGIDPAEYHSWTGCSSSRLKALAQSPAHCLTAMIEPYKATEATIRGTALHCAVLEAPRYNDSYAVFEGDRRFKEGKAAWVELSEKYAEENILRAGEAKKVEAMREAIFNSKAAKALLEPCTDVEVSLVWNYSGVICKGRIDGYNPKIKAVIDLKTTTDASFWAFGRSIEKYKYHWQAWHYMNGCNQLGLECEHVIFIAVESEPPYAVGVYRLDEQAMEVGAGFVIPLIEKYGECLANDEWPAYPDRIEDMGLPSLLNKQSM